MSTETLQPTDDTCLVELENIHTTVMFIPEPNRLFAQKVWKGTVTAVGKGYWHELKHNGISTGKVKRIPMTVKTGDIVLIPAHASATYKLYNKRDKTVFVRERDIYAVVTTEDDKISLPRQPMVMQADEKDVLPEP